MGHGRRWPSLTGGHNNQPKFKHRRRRVTVAKWMGRAFCNHLVAVYEVTKYVQIKISRPWMAAKQRKKHNNQPKMRGLDVWEMGWDERTTGGTIRSFWGWHLCCFFTGKNCVAYLHFIPSLISTVVHTCRIPGSIPGCFPVEEESQFLSKSLEKIGITGFLRIPAGKCNLVCSSFFSYVATP